MNWITKLGVSPFLSFEDLCRMVLNGFGPWTTRGFVRDREEGHPER